MNEELKNVKQCDIINEKTMKILQDNISNDIASEAKNAENIVYKEVENIPENNIVDDEAEIGSNNNVVNDETKNVLVFNISNKEAESFTKDNISIKEAEWVVNDDKLENNIFSEEKTDDVEETEKDLPDDENIKTKNKAFKELETTEGNYDINKETEKDKTDDETNIKKNEEKKDNEDSKNINKDKSDDEASDNLEKNDVGDLMTNIFGDESDEEDELKNNSQVDETVNESDDNQLKFIGIQNDSDNDGREWDFDIMLRKKKTERKRKRKNKDNSVLLITDADDQIKSLVDAMTDAANDDRQSNMDKRPAIQKRKMLPLVRSTLFKSDLFETLLDNGMMNAVSEWLAPLPDKSLPALEVRSTLLKILQSYPRLDQGILKQSGLGKAVMFLFKHPKEIRENKSIAAKLIREWSRPIFQLDTDFRSLSREERLQRDFAHLPEQKRQRLSIDDDGMPSSSRSMINSVDTNESQEQVLRPGDAGFIMRARVPKPSTKDYVIRPRHVVEGRFQGASKSRTTDRYDKAEREFRDRNRAQKAKRAIGVSLEGRKMDI